MSITQNGRTHPKHGHPPSIPYPNLLSSPGSLSAALTKRTHIPTPKQHGRAHPTVPEITWIVLYTMPRYNGINDKPAT